MSGVTQQSFMSLTNYKETQRNLFRESLTFLNEIKNEIKNKKGLKDSVWWTIRFKLKYNETKQNKQVAG